MRDHSQLNSIRKISSLNYQNRKKEQARQVEDNIMMLKKIHFAEPVIKYAEQRRHEKST